MVYNLLIRNNFGVQKQFYLSGDSDDQVIKRAAETYSVPRDRITLVEYYNEIGLDELDSKPIPIREKISNKDQKKLDKASEMYYSASKKANKKKQAYIKKYNFNEVKISSVEELADLLKKYKKVKCYWEPSEKRGEHQYYALYK